MGAQVQEVVSEWCENCGYVFSVDLVAYGAWAICPNCSGRVFLYKNE